MTVKAFIPLQDKTSVCYKTSLFWRELLAYTEWTWHSGCTHRLHGRRAPGGSSVTSTAGLAKVEPVKTKGSRVHKNYRSGHRQALSQESKAGRRPGKLRVPRCICI